MLLKDKNKCNRLNYALSILCIILILLTDRSAIISYFYTLAFVFAINFLCDKEYRTRNVSYFHFYVIIALIIFVIQRNQIPSFMGLSGPDGIGTDDGTYYAGVADAPITYDDARLDIAENMSFCSMIRFLYPFRINGPLCIVIFNLLGITFLPYLTSRVALVLFKDNRVAFRSEVLLLFCPFVMSTGLLIMRDVLCTSLLMAAFLQFLNKKYIYFALFAILLGYLKFGFLALLIVPTLIYFCYYGLRKNKLGFITKAILLIVIVLVVGKVALPYLTTLAQGKLEEGLFRMTAVDFLLDTNDKSVLAHIYNYPILIRLPLLIGAFLIIPTLNMGFISDGIFVPRLFLMGFLAPIYWWFVYRSFFNFFLVYKKLPSEAKALMYSILLMALTLGIISLQIRHRITMMPFVYIAIAYAGCNYKQYNKVLTAIVLFLFISAQILFIL